MRKAVKSGRKGFGCSYNLAVTYQHSDDPDKAIQALEKYLQKNPGDMKSWMQLGELQEKKGALPQARSTYEGMLQRNPQNREALMRLVSILEKGKRQDPLCKGHTKSWPQLQPRSKTVQNNLAMLYYGAKKWDKATQAFETVASIDPKDLESRKYLLDLYRKQKNDKGEVEMLRVPGANGSQETLPITTPFSSASTKEGLQGHGGVLQGPRRSATGFRRVAQLSPLRFPEKRGQQGGTEGTGTSRPAAAQGEEASPAGGEPTGECGGTMPKPSRSWINSSNGPQG